MELAVRELKQHQKVRPDFRRRTDQPESLAERRQKLDQQFLQPISPSDFCKPSWNRIRKIRSMQKEQQQADLLSWGVLKWDCLCRLFGE